MSFVLIQPGRCPADLEGIVLKRNSILLSEEFLETHSLEKAYYAEIRVDFKAKIIAIEFNEKSSTTRYKISYPKNVKYGVIQINKLITLLGNQAPRENKQIIFDYKEEHEGMENVFLLDLSPFFGEEE